MRRVIARRATGVLMLVLVLLLALAACAGDEGTLPMPEPVAGTQGDHGDATAHEHGELDNALPVLSALGLAEGDTIQVVATTNIIADVVAQVGGNHVTVSALMPPGVDPHSYSPTPQDLRLLNDADVIFVNGLDLEEALLPILTNLDREVPIVAVNVGVEAVAFDDEHDHHDDDPAHEHDAADDHHHDDDEHPHDDADYTHDDHENHDHEDHAHEHDADDHPHDDSDHGHAHHHDGDDPHTWQSVRNVMVWVENVQTVLRALDPDRAADYTANAQNYRTELDALDAEIRSMVAAIPAANRKLVTDHDTFSYFARDYGFQVVGAVIPGFSTLAAPSAQELAALQDQLMAEGVPAIFVGTTVSSSLAERLAGDLGIQVVALYSDSLSDADGPASTYVEFMRYNTGRIVEVLR